MDQPTWTNAHASLIYHWDDLLNKYISLCLEIPGYSLHFFFPTCPWQPHFNRPITLEFYYWAVNSQNWQIGYYYNIHYRFAKLGSLAGKARRGKTPYLATQELVIACLQRSSIKLLVVFELSFARHLLMLSILALAGYFKPFSDNRTSSRVAYNSDYLTLKAYYL